MRKPAAAAVSVAWGVAVGGTFGCLLPYLLGDWHFHRPLPYWAVAQAAGGLLICAGLVRSLIRLSSSPRPTGLPCRWRRRHAWW
jgi:hypothetical protein